PPAGGAIHAGGVAADAPEDCVIPEFVQAHSQHWADYFSGPGPDTRQLAPGVGGAGHDLGDGRDCHVSRARRVIELERMQGFYAEVAAAGLHFRTPEFLAIERVNSMSVTYERKLPGQPLQQRLALDDHAIDPAAARCIAEVLRALADVSATPVMRQ